MKYKNVKTEFKGKFFDSKKECLRYTELLILEKYGKIKDLQCQVPFQIVVNGHKICRYLADFVYLQDGKQVAEDVKSAYTAKLPVYRLKKKLMKACLGIDIMEVL